VKIGPRLKQKKGYLSRQNAVKSIIQLDNPF